MDYKNFKKLIKEELNLLNEIQNDCTCTCTWSWDLCPDGGGHASNYFDSTWTAVGDIGMYGSTTCGGFCTSACGVHCANGTANSVASGGSSTNLIKIPGDKVPQSVFNAIDIGVTYGKPIKMKRSRTKDKLKKDLNKMRPINEAQLIGHHYETIIHGPPLYDPEIKTHIVCNYSGNQQVFVNNLPCPDTPDSAAPGDVVGPPNSDFKRPDKKLREAEIQCYGTCQYLDEEGNVNYFSTAPSVGHYGSTNCDEAIAAACAIKDATPWGVGDTYGTASGPTHSSGGKLSMDKMVDPRGPRKPNLKKPQRTIREMYNQCFGTCVREEPHPITGGAPYQYTYFNTAPMPYHYGSSNCDEAIAAACATKDAIPYGVADPGGPRKPSFQKLRKTIKRELHNIQENKIVKKYNIPPEIKDALEDKLKMSPLIRFVKNLKAVNSIPPSYRIFLLNGQHFDIYYEDYSLMAKIGVDEYYLADLEERNYAVKHINRLMTKPIPKIGDDQAADAGGTATPPASPADEPTPEPEV